MAIKFNLKQSGASSDGASATKSYRLTITTTKKYQCSRVTVCLRGKEKKTVTYYSTRAHHGSDVDDEFYYTPPTTKTKTNVFYNKSLDDGYCITEKLLAKEPPRPGRRSRTHLPKGTHVIPIEIDIPERLPPTGKEVKEERDKNGDVEIKRERQIYYEVFIHFEGSNFFSSCFDKKGSLPVHHRDQLTEKMVKYYGVSRAEASSALKKVKQKRGPFVDEYSLMAFAYYEVENSKADERLKRTSGEI